MKKTNYIAELSFLAVLLLIAVAFLTQLTETEQDALQVVDAGEYARVLVGLFAVTLVAVSAQPLHSFSKYLKANPTEGAVAAEERAQTLLFWKLIAATGVLFSWVVLVTLAPQLADIAMTFAPYEYFWLCVFGLTVIVGMETKQPIKALLATLIGLVIAMVGIDPVGGFAWFTFGSRLLRSGFRTVPVLMGFFVVSEILSSLSEIKDKYVFADEGLSKINLKALWVDKVETLKNMLSASAIGTFLGILPRRRRCRRQLHHL